MCGGDLKGAVCQARAIFAVNVPDIVALVDSTGQDGYDRGG
jgi:hypothetical protein